jgi:hypothetical protein
MSLRRVDHSLQEVLDWAMERMRNAGFAVNSKVSIIVDPVLNIMGYAKEKDGIHYIVVADWALDSEMLGGLVLHELAHIHSTENNVPTHDHRIINELLSELKKREGLSKKEIEYLIDAFNHLQNIIVDDIVFRAMSDKELKLAQRFFAGWITERPSGDQILDAALLVRNAFAIASLKRRGLLRDDEVTKRNLSLLYSLGDNASEAFEWLEKFLKQARDDWSDEEFRIQLKKYLEKVLSLMRENPNLQDLR